MTLGIKLLMAAVSLAGLSYGGYFVYKKSSAASSGEEAKSQEKAKEASPDKKDSGTEGEPAQTSQDVSSDLPNSETSIVGEKNN